MEKVLLLLLLLPFVAPAQENSPDTIFIESGQDFEPNIIINSFRDKDAEVVKNTEGATDQWEQRKYYKTHELAEVCPFTAVPGPNGYLIRQINGTCLSYYKNGQLHSKITYIDNTPSGEFELYFRNGKIMSQGSMEQDNKRRYYSICDTFGHNLLKNGTGIIEQSRKTSTLLNYTEILDSVCIARYTVDLKNNDTIYTYTGTDAEPRGGWDNFWRQFKKVYLPDLWTLVGRKASIEITIAKNGSISKIRNLNPINLETDFRLTSSIRNIIGSFERPKLSDGRNVKFVFLLPIRIGN